MDIRIQQRRAKVLLLLGGGLALATASASCRDHEGKLDPDDAMGGSADSSPGGAAGEAGTAAATSGEAGRGGAMPEPNPSLAGAAGSSVDAVGGGGASAQPQSCIYQTDVVIDVEAASAAGGAGGDGGAGGGTLVGGAGEGGQSPSYAVGKATNRLIGDYLTDVDGRALYVFGADLAGDCEAPPISTCEGDCLLSWPIFHAQPRTLAEGIDPAAFGSIERADGLPQTTYYGWPLYYYANDDQPGEVTGHGAGVWGLAELILPNVVVRRLEADRFLADGGGRTLYRFADDTPGTSTSAPVSACVGACLEAHPPFSPSYVGAISTLEPRDFTSFVRSDGIPQVAYKGSPLYYSDLDRRPGAINGAEDAGFTIVLK